MTSLQIDEQMTTNAGFRRKKSKEQEKTRCFPRSETQPPMKSLSTNAQSFTRYLDSWHDVLKTNVEKCQSWHKEVELVQRFVESGVWFGILHFVLMCALFAYFRAKLPHVNYSIIILYFIYVFALKYRNKSNLEKLNLCIREFKSNTFLLVVELAKLKQRCEDVKGTLGSGLENLERLEESITLLLDQISALTDAAALQTVNKVLLEYVTVLHELEKMNVRLSFYIEPYLLEPESS